ncbi:MAG: hypothetical protein JNL05_10415 [Flavobacteriales bacterium]|nr:hypothetical protein [Flavobacteriales bacterium]
MADVRFRIDHHHLGIAIKVIDLFLDDQPSGEMLNMMHSILQVLVVRLKRRHAERRLEYPLILPVYQALAMRRVLMAGIDLIQEEQVRLQLRLILAVMDPKMTPYTVAH